MEKMERVNITLRKDQIEKLQTLNIRRSDLIRRLIDEYLKKEERTMKKFVIAFLVLAMMAMAVPAMAANLFPASNESFTVICDGMVWDGAKVKFLGQKHSVPAQVMSEDGTVTFGYCLEAKTFVIIPSTSSIK